MVAELANTERLEKELSDVGVRRVAVRLDLNILVRLGQSSESAVAEGAPMLRRNT